MPKYNKVYPSFYNGISQQIPELMHETNCTDMLNCIPDLVLGASKRPPAKYVGDVSHGLPGSRIFHSYDRGEDSEEYLLATMPNFGWTDLAVFTPEGHKIDVNFESGTDIDYLKVTDHRNLKAVTVQDTTFIINTEQVVGIEDSPQGNVTSTESYMSLSGGIIDGERIPLPPGVSGSIKFGYTYSFTAKITLDGDTGTLVSQTIDKETYSSTDSALSLMQQTYLSLINSMQGFSAIANGTNGITITKDDGTLFTANASGYSLNMTRGTINTMPVVSAGGTASSEQEYPSAFYWAKRASGDNLHQWRYVVYLDGLTFQSVHHESDNAMELLANAINANPKYKAQKKGSILKIDRADGQDFSFDSWDSWGDQASFGWKGSVAKLTDLPQDLGWEGHVVEIVGTDANDFTDYYVRSTKSAWQETRDPNDSRGTLTNMPLILERTETGEFSVRNGDWEIPKVGSEETNPTPSFVGSKLTDVFFYKNRLGLASNDNIVMSELGGYYNFYIKSVLTVLDTDPIDIAISSTSANSIQHALPFQGSLFIFTRDSQYELTYSGTLSPTTVNVDLVSSYPMAVRVKPVVSGDSLYFISMNNNRQQLRHYAKNNDSLTVVGVDLSLTTPTLMSKEIVDVLVNEVLGFVICTTSTFEVYVYNYKENSRERVQSAWSRWEFYQGIDLDLATPSWDALDKDSIQYNLIGSNLYLTISKESGGES